MKILIILLFALTTKLNILQPRKLFEQSLYNENAMKKALNADISKSYKKEVDGVTKQVDESMRSLHDQKFAMEKIMDKTLERKADYIKYAYHKVSYEIDSTLNYLLNKIAQIDGGPDAKTYLKENDYNKGYDN